MNQLPVLTASQRRALLAFHRASKPGQTLTLDPSKPEHRAFIETMLSTAGRTAEKFPHLFRVLATKTKAAKSAKSKDGSQQIHSVHLVDAGQTASGKATATVWARSAGDTLVKGGNLLVFDGGKGTLLAQGENIAVRNGFLACPTRSATAAGASKKLSILYLGHTTDMDGATRFFSYADNAAASSNGIQVNVEDPRIKTQGNTDIVIAVGRTRSQQQPGNADYVYIEPSQDEGSSPYLIVPFKGNVALSGTIDFPKLSVSDMTTSVILNNGQGSTVTLNRATQYTTDQDFLAAFTEGSQANILQWEFPYDQKGYQTTQSIVYDKTSLGNETESYFYFAFSTIPLKGGNTAPPFYVCSKDTPEEPSINCTKIPNLYFSWHCLAKGTRVTLEDGRQVAVEKIDETYRVRTGTNGSSLAVWGTVLGHHSSDPDSSAREEIYRLITANGKKITATEHHMVGLDNGQWRAIAHLAPGDIVMTDEGPSAVKSVKPVAHSGMFYGLLLGNVSEQSRSDFPHNNAGFYGGGILSGDQQVMRHHIRKAQENPAHMLPRIDSSLHTDYMSALGSRRFASMDATASQSVIQNLYYVSPYATLPPGFGNAGIILQTVSSLSPTPSSVQNAVLVFRLREAVSGMVLGTTPTSGPGTGVKSASLVPSFPLSAAVSYMIDIIWVTSGTPPENIDWNSAVTSAPIVASEVNLQSATTSYDGTTLTISGLLSYGPNGIGAGAQVNAYSLSSGTLVSLGSAQTQNNVVSFQVQPSGYPPAFFLSVQAAIPATNSAAGAFSAPFSLGPPTPINNSSGTAQYGGIPQAVSALAAAAYDGDSVSLSWTLGTQQGCVNPDSSLIQVLSGTQLIASFTGGTGSANIPLDVLGQSGISMTVASVASNISSTPMSFSLITQTPAITNVTVASATTVTADVAAPSGLSASAYLMEGSKVLAGPVTPSSGTATFSYNAAGMVGLTVVANAVSSDGKVTGPQSPGAALLATAPSLLSATIYTDPSTSANWRVDLEWERLPDAGENVASYTAGVFQGTTNISSQTTTGTTTSLSFAKTNVTSGQTQTIQLYATGSSGGVSPTQTLYAVFAPPILAGLSATNEQVSVQWTAPTIPGANTQPVLYQPVVSTAGATIYSGPQTASTQASIPIAEIAFPSNTSLLVMVNVSLGPVTLVTDTSMAAGSSATPILTAPITNAVTAAALTNLSTLNWNPVTGASAYNIYFSNGTSQTNISTTSYTLPAALTASSQLGYMVQPAGTSNGVAVTGPWSAVSLIPVTTVNVYDVRFDGSNVVVSWNAAPDALCYNVFVYDDSSNQTYSGTTTDTTLAFTITPDTSKTYTAYVQPVTSGGAGLCGATLPLFSAGLFLSQQPSSAAYPYVYPAQSMAALGTSSANPTAQAITLYLPELGTAAGALGTTPITVDPFTIQPSGNAALPYQLTIAADSVAWGFDTTSIRATLQQNYVSFLKNIEAPGGGLSGATPYGIWLVQSAIACMLPQTFAEQLYYNFGFSTSSNVGAGYVDLRPGMILRVVTGDYVNIGQSNPPSWINGYAGASVMDFEIGSYTAGTNWRTGFDNFLNALSAQGALSVTAPAQSTNSVQAGVSGAIDLYYTQFVQPFYRIYFPSAVSVPWGTGSNTTTSNFTLVAAGSYTGLQSSTVDPSANPTAYFRGRTTLEMLIKVLVNGNERLVPVGTSIGNLLEQLGMRPAATSTLFKQLRVYRSVVAAITSTTPASSIGPQMELRLDWNGLQVYGTGTGFDAMSAPLMPGDQAFIDQY